MAGQHFGAPSGGFAWGPPAGLAGLLAQDKQQVEEGFKALGSVAGGVTAGAIGGFQGAANPEVFGEGTSSTSGAFQGFATNYDKAMNGGGQGGFGALVGGGGGEGGGGGGMNFKQLQQQGKVADQFWKLMADGQPKMDGEDPKALGVTKEQWDTFGARDKWGVVSNAFRQQQMQSQALAYKKGMEDLASHVADRQREADTLSKFNAGYQGFMADNTAGGTVTPDLQAQAFAAGAEASGDPNLIYRSLAQNSREELGGPPQIIDGPYPDTKILTDARGRGTPQVIFNPASKKGMTDYQKAELANKARQNYLEARRQVDTLTALKDDKYAQSLVPGAREAMRAAQEELQSYGFSAGQPAAAEAQANISQEEYQKLKPGDPYWWNGKQFIKK